MADKPIIEIYEVRDDPREAISDAVSAEIRHQVKTLEPSPPNPSQGRATYKRILPGIMQMPADWLIAWGAKTPLRPLTLGPASCPIGWFSTFLARRDPDPSATCPGPCPGERGGLI